MGLIIANSFSRSLVHLCISLIGFGLFSGMFLGLVTMVCRLIWMYGMMRKLVRQLGTITCSIVCDTEIFRLIAS